MPPHITGHSLPCETEIDNHRGQGQTGKSVQHQDGLIVAPKSSTSADTQVVVCACDKNRLPGWTG